VANFVGVLGKAGCRRAVGGQIWRDHLYDCVFEQTPSSVVWISP
jgi:hypothetical protein